MTTKKKLVIAGTLIGLAAVARLSPHPWNFAPVAAAALFAGAYLGGRYAAAVPIVAMLLSDLILGFYEWPIMVAVYASFLLASLVGLWIGRQRSIERLLAGSLTVSVVFFLVTNFAVWKFAGMYAQNIDGLLRCYTLALPFFRNTLMGDLFYSLALFGAYEAALAGQRWLVGRGQVASQQ